MFRYQAFEPYQEQFLSVEEVQWLLRYSDEVPYSNAEVAQVHVNKHDDQHFGVDNEHRRSNIKWIRNNPMSKWLHEKIAYKILEINSKLFKFNLHETEALQYTEYCESYKGCFNWHHDIIKIGNNIRKLTVSICLTDPLSYVGGEFQFFNGTKNNLTVNQPLGSIIVFPSWIMHQVTPVTKGKRITLVTWANGPEFI